ncbi:hypothetical protein Tco_1002033 [Tanacetum coccineum]|uniref:Retrotransposon gag domain-containing protein n=1 Tax=Tanacetum coccineum TaxID=301880 RepID=A0ABQ5F6H9_9ASTR
MTVAGARETVGRQEVPTVDLGTDTEPLEHVHNDAEYNVFANVRQHFEQPESTSKTCLVDQDDSNVTPDSPDMLLVRGRAQPWWNGNASDIGHANANQIPWSNVKAMMTTEYCPATEIQRMEQELWTLTLKGDDIEAYNNRFHELALMCPELVPTKKKKIE